MAKRKSNLDKMNRASAWYSMRQRMLDDPLTMDCDTLHEAMKVMKTATQKKLEDELMGVHHQRNDSGIAIGINSSRRIGMSWWEREFNPEKMYDTWWLNRKRLHAELTSVAMNHPALFDTIRNNPTEFDRVAGPGAWKTYTQKKEGDKVALYYDPTYGHEDYKRKRERAYSDYYHPKSKAQRQAAQKILEERDPEPVAGMAKTEKPISGPPAKMRARPPGHERIRSRGEDLLAELQDSFDRWVSTGPFVPGRGWRRPKTADTSPTSSGTFNMTSGTTSTFIRTPDNTFIRKA